MFHVKHDEVSAAPEVADILFGSGVEGARRYAERFTPARVAARYARAYNRLLKRRRLSSSELLAA